jgi:hypothetical protein
MQGAARGFAVSSKISEWNPRPSGHCHALSLIALYAEMLRTSLISFNSEHIPDEQNILADFLSP